MWAIKRALNALIILLAMVSLSIFVTINLSPFLYNLAIYYFHLHVTSGRSSASLMKCYFFIIRYLEVPWDTKLRLVFFKASLRGLRHFRDVRRLVMFNNLMLIIFNYLGVKRLIRLRRSKTVWELIEPFEIIFTGLMITAAFAFINFQQFFINFHRVMFRNKDWVFNSVTDPVIKVLPMPYFGWCFVGFAIIGLIMIGSLIFYAKRSLKKGE